MPYAAAANSANNATRWPTALLGQFAIRELRKIRYLAAVTVAILVHALRPSTWTRAVRQALSLQIVFAGVGAAGFTAIVAFLAGLMIVVQVQFWLGRVGQSRFLGPLLVAVIVRELGPLLANLIVIGRSGSATAVALAHMKVSGEVRALEAMGVDPFIYLVLPRALGMCLASFCLSVLLIVVALLGGYACATALGLNSAGLGEFMSVLARSIQRQDVVNIVMKSLLPGLVAGAISCTEGLAVQSSLEIPSAGAHAVQRSLAILFIVSATVSVFTYL